VPVAQLRHSLCQDFVTDFIFDSTSLSARYCNQHFVCVCGHTHPKQKKTGNCVAYNSNLSWTRLFHNSDAAYRDIVIAALVHARIWSHGEPLAQSPLCDLYVYMFEHICLCKYVFMFVHGIEDSALVHARVASHGTLEYEWVTNCTYDWVLHSTHKRVTNASTQAQRTPLRQSPTYVNTYFHKYECVYIYLYMYTHCTYKNICIWYKHIDFESCWRIYLYMYILYIYIHICIYYKHIDFESRCTCGAVSDLTHIHIHVYAYMYRYICICIHIVYTYICI
jgi:hypothetical protein